jgi:hypothetical protein
VTCSDTQDIACAHQVLPQTPYAAQKSTDVQIYTDLFPLRIYGDKRMGGVNWSAHVVIQTHQMQPALQGRRGFCTAQKAKANTENRDIRAEINGKKLLASRLSLPDHLRKPHIKMMP